MSLFERDTFEAYLRSLPAVEIVHQWGDASVGKVGGKIFAILSIWDDDPHMKIGFKCSDLSFQMLPELHGVMPARYLARAKWVQVAPGSDLTEDDVRAYIAESHRLVAAKLPKRLREQLAL